MLPLLAVLAITAAKDGYEDVKRHQSDRTINRQKIRVMTAADWTNPNIMQAKERSITAVWYELKHRFFGTDKRKSKKLREQWNQRQSLGGAPEVVSNPQLATADAPGGGAAPDAAVAASGTNEDTTTETPTTPALGRSISGVSSEGRSIRRTSTIGGASINSAYETMPDGRVLKNGRELTPEEMASADTDERAMMASAHNYQQRLSGYAMVQGTRPQAVA